MTFKGMVRSIYRNSMGHVLNGEKMTQEEMEHWFRKMFHKKHDEDVLFSMNLPDGVWLCLAMRRECGYDYIVPDTREDEGEVVEKFLQNKVSRAVSSR